MLASRDLKARLKFAKDFLDRRDSFWSDETKLDLLSHSNIATNYRKRLTKVIEH